MNEVSTFDIEAMQIDGPPSSHGLPVPAGGPPMMVSTTRGIVTAQRVALPRNVSLILQQVKANCAAFGQTYIYSWEVKDRANNRKQTVEGGTIKLANMLARAYGNCHIGVEVENTQTHTIFKAIFTDIETGFTLERPFQQRKSMDIGSGYDSDRKADMVFQIGVSKAIRNVVLNALPDITAYAIEESKKALITWLDKDGSIDKAHAYIAGVMEEHGIDVKQVEAVVGRVMKDWTKQNLARVMTEMRAIADGFASASEVYPSLDKAAEVKERKAAKDRMDDMAGKSAPAVADTRVKDTPKQDAPKTDTKPADHDPETGEVSDQPQTGADAPADEEPQADNGGLLFGAD